MNEKRKLLYWEGSSKKDFKEFPTPVQKDMGVALFLVQLGRTPQTAKPWRGLGPGVYELVEDHRGDTYLSRGLHGTYRGCSACAACVSEEIQVRHRHAATGRGIDRKAVEGSACPIWGRREIMMAHKEHPQGTDNVLVDLGFDDAEELSAKTLLAIKLNDLVDKRGLSQTETARLTGMTQPKVSQIRRYKLQNISLERLMQALVSLDQHVEIVVRPAHRTHQAGIKVTA
ncbi:XRE family transcriptional regulator [Nitrosospira multiformis]|uniref:XRE family transcriptional regulator n=1 Tax=Nitrosospira multiformis TaxID=1231 RepID=UPI00089661B1|nr:Helix-turn-helix domain-containing protein [Nitrosospira multiformis]